MNDKQKRKKKRENNLFNKKHVKVTLNFKNLTK